MNPIDACSCGAFDGMVKIGDLKKQGQWASNGVPSQLSDDDEIHMTSVVLTESDSGKFQVICLECYKTGSEALTANHAINRWNYENKRPVQQVIA